MVARVAALGVTVILLVALYVGAALLSLFGIGIGAFATAGGIIIFLVALQMIAGTMTAAPPEGQGHIENAQRFALVPLAIPLLAGPGPICSVIVYATKGPTSQGCTPLEYVILTVIILAVGLA